MISVISMYAILTFVVMESHLVSYQTSYLDTSMCMSNKRTKHGFSGIELILSIVLSSEAINAFLIIKVTFQIDPISSGYDKEFHGQ